MQKPLAIEATGLKKSFGEASVLDGLDLRIETGKVFALLGPNGAGKTTTVRILTTLTEADDGTATVAGFDVRAQRAEVRRRIAFTGQYAAVDELQTGAENLRMMGRLCGLSRTQARVRAEQLLSEFDLMDAAHRTIKTYSGGMRRRLDLAASIVVPRSIIFLDEPTTGLDPRSRQSMWDVVTRLVANGVTVFLTTQYLEEADQLADHIAVVDAGRVVAEGTANELKRRVAGQRLDTTFATADAFARAEQQLGSRAIHRDPAARTLGMATEGRADEIRHLLDVLDPHRTDISHFAVHTATLDDVFLAITGAPSASSVATDHHQKAVADA